MFLVSVRVVLGYHSWSSSVEVWRPAAPGETRLRVPDSRHVVQGVRGSGVGGPESHHCNPPIRLSVSLITSTPLNLPLELGPRTMTHQTSFTEVEGLGVKEGGLLPPYSP